ncbi:MAG: tetratricopeptide repeat protein [Candidatus Krumholzibacteria bacterium]|jgi:tetratricopeptide (TPR) repeat protein|nr:tetratricopeptide repeat protein [Candidatus Krumholzibacteria bacterium]MDP6669577.1 tetratricopeptide repeat protein [Candidatus Krumholzibacteria bacterium]MDP6796434.1 tetratricopeptide repeat protein [Candidatus Krumholzibacteria bacterium]MDP7021049.1 tetratricopeptide repeat protein [Candidatus Krumholzibacteria bacterium]
MKARKIVLLLILFLIGLAVFTLKSKGEPLAVSRASFLMELGLPLDLVSLQAPFQSKDDLRQIWCDRIWEQDSELGFLEKIEAIKIRLREDPDNALLSKLLGDAFFDYARDEGGQSYLDSALYAYENAALKMGDFLPAVGSVGRLYDEREDYDQAVYWYEKALELAPLHVPTLCNAGGAEYNRGNVNAAMDFYRRALAADPGSQDAHYNLGVAFAESRMYGEAVVEWEKVVAIDPTTPVAAQADTNAKLLRDVLQETVYREGKKIRRLGLGQETQSR